MWAASAATGYSPGLTCRLQLSFASKSGLASECSCGGPGRQMFASSLFIARLVAAKWKREDRLIEGRDTW